MWKSGNLAWLKCRSSVPGRGISLTVSEFYMWLNPGVFREIPVFYMCLNTVLYVGCLFQTTVAVKGHICRWFVPVLHVGVLCLV